MQFEVFTLFPEIIPPYLEVGVLGKAIEKGLVEVRVHDIRDYTHDRHRMTDDVPYGGGGGMVMKPEPLFEAVETVLGKPPEAPVVLLTPQGEPFSQKIAESLAGHERIGLICGRYEGVDERVREHLVAREISIGDFVLTGGELPALLVMDAIGRLVPGVLGDPDGAADDSHASGLLEYPHYTRPFSFRGWEVPEVLRSGDHGRIARWRREQSLLRTLRRRPDLLEKLDLDEAERKFLAGSEGEENG
ncbi:MAG TPA: tRNA (guanosine(37)-N1)-methyltransferase TrmD [Anaerolineales bacterium]|nr:tRNA (guanosine(37)-N1)-methyltransferase TrmD [Anaerolineales bacterium]